MTAATTLIAEPTVQRLGWVLVHSLWQGAVVAAMLGAALRLMRQRSATARYTLSCGALALLAALPALNFVFVPRFHPATMSAAKGVPPRALQELIVPESVAGAIPAMTAGSHLSFAAEPEAVPTAQPSVASRLSLYLEPRFPWIVGAWALGVVALSVWHLGGWVRVQRLRRTHTRPLGTQWERTLLTLASRLRVTRPVRLLESALVQVPAVIGWLRPVILVPASAVAGLSPQELEAILAHELAHVRRHDYLVNVLQAVVETVQFYHPAVWWVSHRVRLEREHCCDDVAGAACGALVYARALAKMEELRAADSPAGIALPLPRAALAAVGRGGPLLRRIRRLVAAVDRPAAPPRPSHGHALAAAVVVAVLAVASVVGQSRVGQDGDAPGSAPAGATRPDSAPRDEDDDAAPAVRRVLLVTSDNYFLQKALEAAVGVEATVIRPIDYTPQLAARFAVVVLDKYMPDRWPDAGGVIIFGGVPAEIALNPGVKPEEREFEWVKDVSVTAWKKDHAIFSGLDLNKVFVQTAAMVTPPADAEVLMSGGMDGRVPLAVLHRQQGRRFLVLPFHLADSDWPLKISFPVFVARAVDYMAAGAPAAGGQAPANPAGVRRYFESDQELDAAQAELSKLYDERIKAARALEAEKRKLADLTRRYKAGEDPPGLPEATEEEAARRAEDPAAWAEIKKKLLASLIEESRGRLERDGRRLVDIRNRVEHASQEVARRDAERRAAEEGPAAGAGDDARLRALVERRDEVQTQLEKAKLTLLPEHATVVRLRQELDSLDKRVQAVAAEAKAARDNAANPVAAQDGTYYISGVPRDGAYSIGKRPVKLLQALISGGLDVDQNRGRPVVLFRRTGDGNRETTTTLTVGDLIENRDKDVVLKADDMIMVKAAPQAAGAAAGPTLVDAPEGLWKTIEDHLAAARYLERGRLSVVSAYVGEDGKAAFVALRDNKAPRGSDAEALWYVLKLVGDVWTIDSNAARSGHLSTAGRGLETYLKEHPGAKRFAKPFSAPPLKPEGAGANP